MSRTKLARPKAAGPNKRFKAGVAALGAFENPAGDVAAVFVSLAAGRQELAGLVECKLHDRECL